MPQTITIIGFGKFGAFWAELLKNNFPELNVEIIRSAEIGTEAVNQTLAASKYIFPCVPISAFAETITKIAPYLSAQNTVVSVCSIMTYPKEQMLTILPKDVEIITTHPNFGPESFKQNQNSVKNFNFIIENTKATQETYQDFLNMLNKLELNVAEISADEHDLQISLPHFVSLFTGNLLKRLEIKRDLRVATSTKKMFELVDAVGQDFQILKDIYAFNPYAKTFSKKLFQELANLEKDLQNV